MEGLEIVQGMVDRLKTLKIGVGVEGGCIVLNGGVVIREVSDIEVRTLRGKQMVRGYAVGVTVRSGGCPGEPEDVNEEEVFRSQDMMRAIKFAVVTVVEDCLG